MNAKVTYTDVGVDYAVLDEGKRRALGLARATAENPKGRGATIDPASYGEPATVVEIGGEHFAFVLECLGTKSLVAKDVESELGIDRFVDVGYDTVAAAVNDCLAVGALPLVVNAYFGAGADFYVGGRHDSLVEGFRLACDVSAAAWGGGESPTLPGLVEGGAIDLAAAVLGMLPRGCAPLLGAALEPGDEIVLVASSGLHQNGASLARRVAAHDDASWSAELPSGRVLGDAVLDRGLIYVALMEALYSVGAVPHYASHVTGHGWRKLMRAERELTYRIDTLPPVPEVFAFLIERAGLSPAEAYGTFNMGAGLALYVAPATSAKVIDVARSVGIAAYRAGRVEDGPRRVIVEPIGVEYARESLGIR
jgi:phosphoribosylformylglycinamidine cyclo-ligase